VPVFLVPDALDRAEGSLAFKRLNQFQESLFPFSLNHDVNILILKGLFRQETGMHAPPDNWRIAMFLGDSGDLESELKLGSGHGRNPHTYRVVRKLVD